MGMKDDINKNTAAQKEFNSTVQDGQESFREYGDILKSINAELGRNYSTTKDARSEYDSLVSITQKLAQQEEGINRIADDKLKKLAEQASANLANLKIIGAELSGREAMNDAELALQIAAEEKFGGIMSGYNDVAKAQKEFRQQTGQNISHVDTLNGSIATSADYIKAASSLSKELGVNASVVFSPETITEVAELTELMGMGAHEAAQLAKFAKLSGKELSVVTSEMEASFKSFVQTNQVGINFQDVMNDVGSASASVTLSLGSNPKKIQAAAMEARKLGVSLEQVDKIAGSLLDFESSISAELEAELLTGQSLNLEKARQLALSNDLEGVAKELAKNEGIMKAFWK